MSVSAQSGPVAVGGIAVNVDGYSLSCDSLSLSSATTTIDVASGATAAISAALVGRWRFSENRRGHTGHQRREQLRGREHTRHRRTPIRRRQPAPQRRRAQHRVRGRYVAMGHRKHGRHFRRHGPDSRRAVGNPRHQRQRRDLVHPALRRRRADQTRRRHAFSRRRQHIRRRHGDRGAAAFRSRARSTLRAPSSRRRAEFIHYSADINAAYGITRLSRHARITGAARQSPSSMLTTIRTLSTAPIGNFVDSELVQL